MWGALGTQPGKRLAERADGINPHCATLRDPSREWPGAGVLSCVFWVTGAPGQDLLCSWEAVARLGSSSLFEVPSLSASTCSPSVCLSLSPPLCASR